MERWLTHPVHTDYEVSDHGRVRRRTAYFSTVPGKILKPVATPSGYRTVHIRRNGRFHHTRIHVLVLETFVGPAPTGCQTRHKDGDKTNNALSNLAWGTPAENYADRVRHGTRNDGERNGQARINSDTALDIRRRVAAGESQSAIARELGLSTAGVNHVVRRYTWGHI